MELGLRLSYNRTYIEVKVYSIADDGIVTFFEEEGSVYQGALEDFPGIKLNDVLTVALTIDDWVIPEFTGGALEDCSYFYRRTWSEEDENCG